MALIKVQKAILINKPVEEVYAFAVDHFQAHLWQDGLILYEKLTEGDIAVGTRFKQKYKEGYELDILVTGIEPNTLYASTIEHKWTTCESRSEFKEHAPGITMVKSNFTMKLKVSFLDAVSIIIEPTVNKKQKASLENLKKVVEKLK